MQRLVAVVRGLEGAVGVHVDVCSLVRRELGELDAQLVEVQRCDLLVQVLGQHVHLVLVAVCITRRVGG
jgi:hypothetical protein